jgi:quercetin 2,3-dioxygenase
VINEDKITAGAGFPTHGHRDMEILTYVLEGGIAHKDSMGTGSTIVPGDVQLMSAGTGVTHSEMNASKTAAAHFYQIWIMPDRAGHKPRYEQKQFPVDERRGKLRVVASPDGRDGSLTIHQDAVLASAVLAAGQSVTHAIGDVRNAWVQVARGKVEIAGQTLVAGDGLAATGAGELAIVAIDDAELLVFDLA